MGNSTFEGAVRSRNGFTKITTDGTTGVDTTNSTYSTNASVGGNLTVAGSVLTGGFPTCLLYTSPSPRDQA